MHFNIQHIHTTKQMANVKKDLASYGISDVAEIYHNLSYDELFQHETNPEITDFAKGFETNLGAVAVDTGIFTGRSPKDKYIVYEDESKDNIWWKDPKEKVLTINLFQKKFGMICIKQVVSSLQVKNYM